MTSSASPTFSIFKNTLSALNPTTLFIATSVGIHAIVLGLILPNVKPDSSLDSTDSLATVDVIELNEVEQSRLPELSSSTFDININDLNLSSPPPVSSFPENTASSIELEPSVFRSSLSTLPPPPPSLPPLNYESNLPINRNLPSSPSITTQNIPIPRSNTLPSLPPPPVSLSESSIPRQRERPQFDPVRDPIAADDLINRKPNLPQLPENSETIATNSPDSPEKIDNFTVETRPNPQEIAAKRLQEERIRRIVAETRAKANSLRYEAENTTTEEAMRNNITWMSKVGEAQPQSENLIGDYPKTACRQKLEGTAIYGVSVAPQGSLTQPPYLIQSSGYPILNQQALQQIKKIDFKNSTEQIQPYRVSVNFQYNPEVCPNIPLGSPQPQETGSTPSPKNVIPSPTSQEAEPTELQAVEETQPPAPAAIRKVPATIEEAEPTEPQAVEETQPPAPAAIRKVPETTQIQPMDTQPISDNQPPAPPATRKINNTFEVNEE